MATVTPQMLATALRDLSAAADRVAWNPRDENERAYVQASDYVERLLEAFVAQEGDILPTYLPSP